MVHVRFTAQLFHLPLKTEENPLDPFTEKQLYDILALLFGYVFLDGMKFNLGRFVLSVPRLALHWLNW